MFKKQLQPLTDGDKAVVILSYLEKRGDTTFQDDNLSDEMTLNLVMGTPQYTLINCLELYYLYKDNTKFAKRINSMALQLRIKLEKLQLTPQFLIRLGYFFISTRPNLDETDIKAISDGWVQKYEDVYKPFATEEQSLRSWVNDIVTELQSYEAIMQVDEDVLDGEYAGMVFSNVTDNANLLKWYQDYRGIK